MMPGSLDDPYPAGRILDGLWSEAGLPPVHYGFLLPDGILSGVLKYRLGRLQALDRSVGPASTESIVKRRRGDPRTPLPMSCRAKTS